MFFAIFSFKTIEAVAWSITITFIINFILTYLVMYLFLFKQNILSFLKQLTPALVLSLLLIIVNILFFKFINIENLFLSFIAKCSLTGTIFLLYIQFSGEYNLYQKAKSFLKQPR